VFSAAALCFVTSVGLFGADPQDFSLFVTGHSPLEADLNDESGLVESVLFVDEPINLTLVVPGVDEQDAGRWAESLHWDVLTSEGTRVALSKVPELEVKKDVVRARVARFAFAMSPLPSGRYVVRASWVDEKHHVVIQSEDRKLTVYRGDESLTVKRAFLRQSAKALVAEGSRKSYLSARTMLLEAASDNTDPQVYEELADISAPWAQPDETASYYKRSLIVAQSNIERRFGRQQDGWPAQATQLLKQRKRKVDVFDRLLPYYRANFEDVRVMVVRVGKGETFVVERRSDGRRLQSVAVER
jgi:hypothetical protein